MIEDLFRETMDRVGLDSAFVEYRALREQFYGGFVYDFRPGPLTGVAEDLAGQERFAEAIRVAEFALEFDPEFYSIHFTLGSIQERAGNRAEALKSMERALELSPPRFRGFLERQVTRLRASSQ